MQQSPSKNDGDDLRRFAGEVERLRDRVAAHRITPEEVRREWDDICAAHETHLAALGGKAGVTRRLIEDLRFDFDVLIHDLYRFIDRNR